ncbi:hypothetical protein B0H10DRAFT_770668 [Mycena sp. CBHHK59/15]|nr:hypothetical protein B0H10DRAFT_770668 [Mycena sp. CBHHK59/15]
MLTARRGTCTCCSLSGQARWRDWRDHARGYHRGTLSYERASADRGTHTQEILLEEIADETDRYEDNVTKCKARRETTAAVMWGNVERRRGVSVSRDSGERTPLLRSAERGAPRVREPLRGCARRRVRLDLMGRCIYCRGCRWMDEWVDRRGRGELRAHTQRRRAPAVHSTLRKRAGRYAP